MSKYRVFSGPYFSVFSPNTGEYGPEKNFVLGHFSRSDAISCQKDQPLVHCIYCVALCTYILH